jgi:hypothetical protein
MMIDQPARDSSLLADFVDSKPRHAALAKANDTRGNQLCAPIECRFSTEHLLHRAVFCHVYASELKVIAAG